jgi:hypothetical protein
MRNAWGIVVVGIGLKFSGRSRNERSLVGISSNPVGPGVVCFIDKGREEFDMLLDGGDLGRNDAFFSRGLVQWLEEEF